jgi:hypothetical protein
MNKRALLVFVCLVGLTAGTEPKITFADSVVIGSNNNALRAGKILDDSASIKLEKSDWLRLMDQKDGKTLTLTGPYNGTVADYARECSIVSRVAGHCSESPTRDPLGGTRGPPR